MTTKPRTAATAATTKRPPARQAKPLDQAALRAVVGGCHKCAEVLYDDDGWQ